MIPLLMIICGILLILGGIILHLIDKTPQTAKGSLPEAKTSQKSESPSITEERQMGSTFNEIPGPFIVTFGGNQAYIPDTTSKSNPSRIINWSGADILYAYIANEKLYVNTVLYGDANLPAVEITDNQFRNIPPQWDKNFNNTALEIVDENLTPRLQLVYKSPRNVVINGIFKIPHGLIIMEETGMVINPSSPINPKFRRIFKYPSRSHQGQELDEPHL
jgi:hypothetical protein